MENLIINASALWRIKLFCHQAAESHSFHCCGLKFHTTNSLRVANWAKRSNSFLCPNFEWQSLFLFHRCKPAGWLRFQLSNGGHWLSCSATCQLYIGCCKNWHYTPGCCRPLVKSTDKENKTLRKQPVSLLEPSSSNSFISTGCNLCNKIGGGEDWRRGLRLLKNIYFFRPWMT